MLPDDPGGGPSLKVDYASVEALATAIGQQGDAATAAGRSAAGLAADARDATVDGALHGFTAAFEGRAGLCGATAEALSTAVKKVAPDFASTDGSLAGGPR